MSDRRVFPIYARFAYPGNGYQGDKDLAAKHLVPGRTYLIDHMDVGRSHTTIYLHDFRDTGFNSVLFAAAWDDDDEDEPGQAQPAAMPDAAVMKILRERFFKGSPDATLDDWRSYCDLIGPGVAEKYGDEEAVPGGR